MTEGFFQRGWCRIPHDAALAAWVAAARPHARIEVAAPENAHWWRCGGTWFAGVNVLPNDLYGAVGESGPLRGAAVDFIAGHLGLRGFAWDRGQVSVCTPGYPRAMDAETPAAFRFRRDRDAAHLDGLHAEGPKRRRHLREYHGFILGIPFCETSPGAAPLVVWQGSHEIVRDAFRRHFAGLPPDTWCDLDVTELYRQTRQHIFDTCRRVEVAASPGAAYLVHRLAIHGVAPWREGATAGPDGRMIVYFRPETGDPQAWLDAP